jgi:hypothetical protein
MSQAVYKHRRSSMLILAGWDFLHHIYHIGYPKAGRKLADELHGVVPSQIWTINVATPT